MREKVIFNISLKENPIDNQGQDDSTSEQLCNNI